jgi:NADH-quinone oxidoreductase subunit N
VSFFQHISDAIFDAVGTSLGPFLPEVVLCATIVLLLLARMALPRVRGAAFGLMLAGSLAAVFLVAPWHHLGQSAQSASAAGKTIPLFTGMLVYDPFSIYMRGLLLGFAVLFALYTRLSGVPGREEATEFYVLVLGATLGMCLMVSANHMMIVFLGVEMASVPSYALAGMLKHRRTSSEAALKFAVFGGATAGVMLYGISLLAGALGSAHLPTMASQLAEMLQRGAAEPRALVLVLGGLMLMVGLAFKLSAVPFHFWAPDVFEGATAEVGAFLSVASKAAALGLLVRLAIGFAHVSGPDSVALTSALGPARLYLAGLVMLLAAVTCTFGNLAAYGQTNIKRLLAYSTIAHAGYMMMPVAAAVVLAGTSPEGSARAVASVVFYAGIYLLMNLGAFAAAAFLRNALGSERIDDYAGLVHRAPAMTVCFSIVLFSLVGLPPLAGFSAKFAIFAALADARLLTLLAIGVLNTVLSLFYYVRVVKVMVLAPARADAPSAGVPLSFAAGLFCLVLAVAIMVLGVLWDGLFAWAQSAAAPLYSS